MDLSISAKAITGYELNGDIAGTYDSDFVREHAKSADNYLSASLSNGGISNAAFVVYYMAYGSCQRKSDSVLMRSVGFDHTVTIVPDISIGAISDIAESENGRDPSSTSSSGWEPSLNSGENGTPVLPGEDSPLENAAESCSGYGRPQYGVNMRILAPGIVDREYFQTTAGPAIDFTRYFNPRHTGIFGRGWRSTLEMNIMAKNVKFNKSGNIILQPARGKNLLFDYNINDKSFTANGNDDTLYLKDNKLVWHNRQLNLFHTFSLLDTSEYYYITEIADLFNNKIYFNYLSPGKISSVSDGAGRTVQFKYNTNGLLESFTTPDGRFTSYIYNSLNILIRSNDLAGYVTEFEYDSLANVTSLAFEGKKTFFKYQHVNGRSFLTNLTDALGNVYNYEMNIWTDFARNTIVYPNGSRVTYNFDGKGNIGLIEYGENVISYKYDTKNGVIEKKLPSLDKVEYFYNANGLLAKSVYNNTEYDTLVYYPNGLLAKYTDRAGNKYRFRYNNLDQLEVYVNPAGDSATYYYNNQGRLSGFRSPDNRFLQYQYDTYGNLTKISDNLGLIIKLSYDNTGHFLKSIADSAGNTWNYIFDNNKRLKTIINPDNTRINYDYGCCAQEGITYENGLKVLYSRNAMNALTGITFPSSKEIKFGYNTNNFLSEVTNPAGDKWKIRYNENNMPVVQKKFNGDSVLYTYNENNLIKSVTDERGNITTFDYIGSKLYSVTDAMNKSRYFYRDNNDRIWKIINARPNSSVTYSYNPGGTVYQKVSGNKTYQYRYDKAGRLISERSGTDSTLYSYDVRGRITGIKWHNGKRVDYSFNSAGKVKSITYPDGYKVDYRYDSNNRLVVLKTAKDSVNFSYQGGKLVAENRSNKTLSLSAFDNYGFLKSITHKKNSDTLIHLAYSYDSNGNIAETDIKTLFAFNFSSEKSMDNATYNNLNQLVSESGNSYLYDEDGNLKSISGNKTLKANYTNENLADSIAYSGTVIRLVFNGLMQPVKENKNGTITLLYYDLQDKLLFESNSNGGITRRYIYAGNRLIAMTNEAGKIFYYHFDNNGSTMALTDSVGNTVAAYNYTPFGNKILEQGTLQNRFKFIGAYNVNDAGNGLYRMGTRWYDPSLGRFIQRDPKGMADGTNMYAYALNNPMLHIDPQGTDVANGTTDLFTCQGPRYGDDFISEETATVIKETVDFATDMAPGISDAKGAVKLTYFAASGEYEKAGMEAISMAGGKYLGGKLLPGITQKLGSKVSEEVAKTISDVAANGTFKVIGDTATEQMENPSENKPAAKKSGPAYIKGPPVGTQY